jgi:hypothetical protein
MNLIMFCVDLCTVLEAWDSVVVLTVPQLATKLCNQ